MLTAVRARSSGVNVSSARSRCRASRGRRVTEQTFEALRPGERAAFYIPIPNRIIRSPGSKRKMFRAFRRAIFCCAMIVFMEDEWEVVCCLMFCGEASRSGLSSA